jgi:hypothetical protein
VNTAHGDILRPSPTGTFADSSQNTGLHTTNSSKKQHRHASTSRRRACRQVQVASLANCLQLVVRHNNAYPQTPKQPHLSSCCCCCCFPVAAEGFPTATPSSRPSSSGWQYSPRPHPALPASGFWAQAVAVQESVRASTPMQGNTSRGTERKNGWRLWRRRGSTQVDPARRQPASAW